MEADPNIMPEMNLGIVDRMRDVGRSIIGLCTYRPPVAPDYMSNHYRGASEMLDHLILDEPTDGEAIDRHIETTEEMVERVLAGYAEAADEVTGK